MFGFVDKCAGLFKLFNGGTMRVLNKIKAMSDKVPSHQEMNVIEQVMAHDQISQNSARARLLGEIERKSGLDQAEFDEIVESFKWERPVPGGANGYSVSFKTRGHQVSGMIFLQMGGDFQVDQIDGLDLRKGERDLSELNKKFAFVVDLIQLDNDKIKSSDAINKAVKDLLK